MWKIVMVLMALVTMSFCSYHREQGNIDFAPHDEEEFNKKHKAPDPKEIREKVIKASFWPSGEHIKLGVKIRKLLHDPDSFSHVETSYVEKEGFLIVQMKYRAKNKLGNKVLEQVTAKVSIDGKVLGIYTE